MEISREIEKAIVEMYHDEAERLDKGGSYFDRYLKEDTKEDDR